MKESPRRLVPLEKLFIRLRELLAALFVGVVARSVFSPELKGLESGRPHRPFVGQLLCAFDVDGAPGAGRLARGEADRIADIVEPPSNPIDPSKAQRFIYRLGPGDAWLAGALFVEADH